MDAIQERGLTLAEVASIARVARITVSSAVRGHAVNASTALRLARAIASRPAIPELAQLLDHSPAAAKWVHAAEDAESI
jgi:transcriptional regulator with XRE-family HTH domain